MKQKDNGPIFIVGAPRSGTTLLQYILRSHPNISLPTGESHFIIPLLKNEHTYGDLKQIDNVKKLLEAMYKQSQEFLDTDLHGIKFDIETLSKEMLEEGRDTAALIINSLFTKNALAQGKQRWGDKTPYYALHIGSLKKTFTNAKFIHIIRDGRDCALSMFNRGRDFNIINWFHAAKYWQQYVEIASEQGKMLGDSEYLEIRYEDLLNKPEEILTKICLFLDEEYSDSLINFKPSSGQGKTPLLQKNIQKGNQEKWRSLMTPAQIKLFERSAGNTLAAYEYPIVYSKERLPLLLRIYYRAHIYFNVLLRRLTR